MWGDETHVCQSGPGELFGKALLSTSDVGLAVHNGARLSRMEVMRPCIHCINRCDSFTLLNTLTQRLAKRRVSECSGPLAKWRRRSFRVSRRVVRRPSAMTEGNFMQWSSGPIQGVTRRGRRALLRKLQGRRGKFKIDLQERAIMTGPDRTEQTLGASAKTLSTV